jgi:4-carboxymuconolactone decarboxylase
MTGTDKPKTKPKLHDPADFGTFGRYAETPVEQMPAPMREAFDFTAELRGQVPGPHRIWASNPGLLTVLAPVGAYFQNASTLSKAEIEIAACVICGRWGAAWVTHEHEKIAELVAGLEPVKVEALIAGLPTAFDDERQQVVYEIAATLAAARVLPHGVFRRAQRLLGDAGISDVTALLGWFTAVSLTLKAYDVPSDATGLAQ